MKIFAYGTLKRGHSRNRYLSAQRFLGEARTAPRYLLFDCGSYPGLIPVPTGAEGRAIEGEVWNVDAACLAILDKVEAIDEGLYRRGRVELASPFDAMAVETYYFNQSTHGLRDCGMRWE